MTKKIPRTKTIMLKIKDYYQQKKVVPVVVRIRMNLLQIHSRPLLRML
jgi:hypothetical protein